jgi:hypothetical protein
MSTVSHPITDVTPIDAKIRSLRRMVLAWLAANGLMWVLVTLVVVIAVDLGIDRFFRMDRAQRVVSLAIMAIILAVVIFRKVIRPVATPLSENLLLAAVERKHRHLRESVISAMGFARGPDHFEELGMSRQMVRATIDLGVASADRVSFRDVLDGQRLALNVLVSLALIAGLAGFAFAMPDTAQTWWNRNVLLTDDRWPQDTHLRFLQIAPGESHITLPRGDDLKLEVEVEQGVVPSQVYLDDRHSGHGGTQVMVHREDPTSSATFVNQEDPAKPRYEYTYKNVLDEFEVRARGGDGETDWITIRLVERPEVTRLELSLTPPSYIGSSSETLKPGQGPYDVYPGSRLSIAGSASKPLSAGKLRILRRGRPAEDMPMKTDADRFSVHLTPEQVRAATYEIEVTDQDQRLSKRPEQFVLRLATDRVPSVVAKAQGISTMIVPQAQIPMAVTLQDDFAITTAALAFEARTSATAAPATPSGSPPDATAAEPDAAPAAPPAPAVGPKGRRPFDHVKTEYGGRKITTNYTLDAQPLGLAVGQDLELIVEAVDNDNVSGPKTGRSSRFQVRVVTEEELRADLLRREREQRKQVEDLLSLEDDIVTETRAIGASLAGRREVTGEDRAALLKIQKRQHQAGERAKMVAGFLDQLVIEAENNRLEGPEGTYQKILRGKVIEPLFALAQKTIPDAARQLDDARRALDGDLTTREQKIATAVETEEKIAAALRDVLKFMVKSEGFQEVVNMLHRALELQGTVNEATKKRLRELFEGRGDQ